MKAHNHLYSVERMAGVFDVSRSGYYKYIQEKQTLREKENQYLLSRIQAAYDESFGLYGSPRIHAVLKEQGIACSPHRVAKLMKAQGLCSKDLLRNQLFESFCVKASFLGQIIFQKPCLRLTMPAMMLNLRWCFLPKFL